MPRRTRNRRNRASRGWSHVEQVPHTRPVVPGTGDLGHVAGDRCVGVQPPLLGEDAGDAADDGLRNRHQQMRHVLPHPPEVTLEHNPAVVHDEDGVGPGVREHFTERRRARLETSDGDVVRLERMVGMVERPCHDATRDSLGGDHLTQVLEGPPVERRLLPVLQVHQRLSRWREALHRGVLGHVAHLIRQVDRRLTLVAPTSSPSWPPSRQTPLSSRGRAVAVTLRQRGR